MLVGPRLGGLGRERVEDPRTARRRSFGRAGGDDPGVGKDAEMPADGVGVQVEPAAQVSRVEAARLRPKCLDDAHTPLVRQSPVP